MPRYRMLLPIALSLLILLQTAAGAPDQSVPGVTKLNTELHVERGIGCVYVSFHPPGIGTGDCEVNTTSTKAPRLLIFPFVP